MSAVNLTDLLSDTLPSIKSEFIEAFDFEVFDVKTVYLFVCSLRPVVTALCVLYIAAVFLGQEFMKSRPAFKLRGPLIAWNSVLAVYSLVTFLRCWPEFWFLFKQKDGLYQTICAQDVHSFPMAFWGLVFLISKVVEFGDTAFIILRKQKLIFLHWYHHAITLYLGFQMYEVYDPAVRIPIILNSFVHTLMYSYYTLTALKIRVPTSIAKCITTLQMLQMVLVLATNLYSLALLELGVPCGRTRSTIFTTLGGAFIFLILFAHFYFQRYSKSKVKSN